MRKLISVFGSPQNVLNTPVRNLVTVEGIDNKTAERIKSGVNEKFVQNQLAHLKNGTAKILTFWDSAYPDRLKRIYDPPAFLFVKGDINLLDTQGIGIVGSRVPTSYGKNITEQLSTDLAQNNLTVISGFARGIDSIAHNAALKNRGKTIAVLGNGLDIVYPAENRKLLDAFEKQGLFVTEYPFGTKPDAGNFPKRNRIISGLSLGILVTEAGGKSGALLTAMYAIDQNREVFAVPGPITSGKSTGCNNLIKQGAKLVQGINDITTELTGQLSLNLSESPKPEPKLTEKEKVIYDLLKTEALHIDQLAIKAGISTTEALTTLLTLELSGIVRQMAGKMFTKL
ncbi:MAG: DNA-protecting protein DprA [Calditrichaeota bacterium]|nr:DNA-protecting protein DprA [Calditrichota bacterium]